MPFTVFDYTIHEHDEDVSTDSQLFKRRQPFKHAGMYLHQLVVVQLPVKTVTVRRRGGPDERQHRIMARDDGVPRHGSIIIMTPSCECDGG